MMDDFMREELWKIRETALAQASINGLNTLWQLAYLDVAKAVNYLDDMIARTEVKVEE